jgi:hypothetical protein
MLIDCETCTVRDIECDDCVVTFLLSTPPVVAGLPLAVRLDDDEAGALRVLADSGLVPPLRLAQGE